jgi:hypothetical protein
VLVLGGLTRSYCSAVSRGAAERVENGIACRDLFGRSSSCAERRIRSSPVDERVQILRCDQDDGALMPFSTPPRLRGSA